MVTGICGVFFAIIFQLVLQREHILVCVVHGLWSVVCGLVLVMVVHLVVLQLDAWGDLLYSEHVDLSVVISCSVGNNRTSADLLME